MQGLDEGLCARDSRVLTGMKLFAIQFANDISPYNAPSYSGGGRLSTALDCIIFAKLLYRNRIKSHSG
jgi:hypothetical protein